MSRELWNEMPPKIQKKTHRKTRNARNHDIEMEKFSCLRRFHSGEKIWKFWTIKTDTTEIV